MYKLVLMRHGQSTWNLENRFTGWVDVDLTDQGREEARAGAQAILDAGLTFDVAYTSVLKRAIRTLWITLDAMDLMWIPVDRSWRLNERHYGNLQGLNKTENAQHHRAPPGKNLQIGRGGQQGNRDPDRMPPSACKKKKKQNRTISIA